MRHSNSASSGMGLGMILFLIFMILKLCGQIAWSWWWVTAPLWIPVGVGLILIVGGLALGVVAFIAACIIASINR